MNCRQKPKRKIAKFQQSKVQVRKVYRAEKVQVRKVNRRRTGAGEKGKQKPNRCR
jgi:hypothetical protein